MLKLCAAASLALSILLPAAGVAGTAESVSYPEKGAAFTVDVPSGWQTMFDNGALKIGGPADALVMFQRVTDVNDEARAKSALPRLGEMAAKTFSMKNAEVATPPAAAEVGKFKGFSTTYKGKDTDNDDAVWTVTTFAPTKGDYYVMTVVYPAKSEKESAAERAAVLASVRAADSSAKTSSKEDSDEADADDDASEEE
jgi:hypothetical protein